jgi:peptide-methionine (S)-S-oxide reductase
MHTELPEPTSMRLSQAAGRRRGSRRTVLTALIAASALAAPTAGAQALQSAVFAGGCFWGVEGVFEHVRGVRSATSGYAGGTTSDPSYREVTTGRTGHAEAVRVVFDPREVSYGQLLNVFFTVAHDPTQLNRQGPDRGTQYRSAVFYESDAQRRAVEAYIRRAGRAIRRPIVTQVAPLERFWPAEEYHQDYMERNPMQPYIVLHDAPKVRRLRAEFPRLYRD